MTMLLAIICAAVAIAAVAAAVILVARHHRKTTDDSGHENHSGDVAYEPAAGVVTLSRTENGNDGILTLYDGLTEQSIDHIFYTSAFSTLIGFVDDNTSILVAHENGKQIDTLKIVGGKMSISDDTNDTFQLSAAGAAADSFILYGLVSPSGRYVFIQCVSNEKLGYTDMCYWDRQQQRKGLLNLIRWDYTDYRPVFDKNDQLLVLSSPWPVSVNHDNRLHVFAPGDFSTYVTLTDDNDNRNQMILASCWMCDGAFLTAGTYLDGQFVIQTWNHSESGQSSSVKVLTSLFPDSASRVANLSFDSQFENYMVAFDTGTVNLYHSNNNLAAVCLLPDDTSDDHPGNHRPDNVFGMFSPDDKILLVLASISQPQNHGNSTIDVCKIVLYNVSGAFDDASQAVMSPEGTVVPQGSSTNDVWKIDNVWFVNSNRFCAVHDDGLGASIIETEIGTDGTINYTVKPISEGAVDELMTTVARERLFSS